MSDDLYQKIYAVFRPLEEKVDRLSSATAEHKMAFRIMGSVLILLGTAGGAMAVGLITVAIQVFWGYNGK